ncbi:hypothetical protein [Millisia brevis]|uniref:hypothetical protein n=1 Tax=Millisia brevis TaxID=264148 RepID=UPI0012EE1D14|nr:hypothetical protein [Millisia brevis]
MKLHNLLRGRQADLPMLPVDRPTEVSGHWSSEQFERLLTPVEIDLVQKGNF